MMSDAEQFLEQLRDPMQFGIRKACFEFFNNNSNRKRIYDIRIQQINELDYYYVPTNLPEPKRITLFESNGESTSFSSSIKRC